MYFLSSTIDYLFHACDSQIFHLLGVLNDFFYRNLRRIIIIDLDFFSCFYENSAILVNLRDLYAYILGDLLHLGEGTDENRLLSIIGKDGHIVFDIFRVENFEIYFLIGFGDFFLYRDDLLHSLQAGIWTVLNSIDI